MENTNFIRLSNRYLINYLKLFFNFNKFYCILFFFTAINSLENDDSKQYFEFIVNPKHFLKDSGQISFKTKDGFISSMLNINFDDHVWKIDTNFATEISISFKVTKNDFFYSTGFFAVEPKHFYEIKLDEIIDSRHTRYWLSIEDTIFSKKETRSIFFNDIVINNRCNLCSTISNLFYKFQNNFY